MSSDQRRAATIEDVAATAGVSRAAVSKVLRGAYGVSDGMRQRVTAAIEQLEYRPRIAARAMRGRSFTIGMEIPDLGNQFFTRMLNGAMQTLADTPYQIVIAPAEPGSRRGLRAIEALVDRQADGVLVVSPPLDLAELERVAGATPIVMLGRHAVSERFDSVDCDDTAGVAVAMRHLHDLGHTRIAHLTLQDVQATDDSPHGMRLRCYEQTMRGAGLADDIHVLRADEGEQAAYETVRAALSQGLDATALFAAHDELAIGALHAIAEAGIQLSVVGYDDVPLASHPALGLTTVYQPGEQMGAKAAGFLLERLEGRTEPRHALFQPELKVRTSTRSLSEQR
ncbi:MAG: LacI family DNA-binding transcriptional regulator [Humibacter sp.]